LNKVSVGSVDNNYDDSRRQLVGLDSKTFSLSGLSSVCPCVSGQKSVNCEFRIEYLTSTGLTKTEYKNIKVECVTDSIPVDDTKVIDPVVVVLEFGTLANPWIINDCNELQDMNNYLDGNYILGEDIDCSDTINWNFNDIIQKYLGFEPIAKDGSKFSGSFNGLGHTISGLYMYRIYGGTLGDFGDYASMFGDVYNANLSFVNLIDANITGKNLVGGIISTMENSVLSNSSYQGEVRGKMYLGGLVAWASGMDYYMLGGNENKIINSYNASSVISLSGIRMVGGLVWTNNYGTILNSYNKGTISVGNAGQVGGLVGVNTDGTINNSYNIGEVNGNVDLGGLIGKNFRTIYGGVNHVFNVGLVNGVGTNRGGIIGLNMNINYISNSYWDTVLSGQATCYSSGSAGCTPTDDLVTEYYGSNGVTKLNNDTNWVSVGNNYPKLSWE